MKTLAFGSAWRAGMTLLLKTSLQALSTRALFRLKVVHWSITLAFGLTGGGGGVTTLILVRAVPLAEQLPASEVARTVTSMVVPPVTPVVSSVAVKPLPEMLPA